MKIIDLINTDLIILDLKGINKQSIHKEMVEKLAKANRITNKKRFLKDVVNREKQGSTALENGIAIPHAKSKYVKRATICFGRSNIGVNCNSYDGKLTTLFFMIAVPENDFAPHLEILEKLTKMLLDDENINKLLNAITAKEVIKILDRSRIDIESLETDLEKVVAVTACPTGIAQTYMASESLKKAANQLQIKLKVETIGSGDNVILSDSDIRNARGVIIASDRVIDLTRFNGKKVLFASSVEAITNSEELLETVMYGKLETLSLTKIKFSNTKNSFLDNLKNTFFEVSSYFFAAVILIAVAYVIKVMDKKNIVAKYLDDIGGKNGALGLGFTLFGGVVGKIISEEAFMPSVITSYIILNKGINPLWVLVVGIITGYLDKLLKFVAKNYFEEDTLFIYKYLLPFINLIIVSGVALFIIKLYS